MARFLRNSQGITSGTQDADSPLGPFSKGKPGFGGGTLFKLRFFVRFHPLENRSPVKLEKCAEVLGTH